uniref:Uncharacterized protein n=1 Tax=Schlesneria paludicola TaxID=360056 RepID=A0A7C2K0V6_9PLAN
MQWLKHAFAIERAERFAPTDAERALADRLAGELARRRLTLPALVLLESLRPLGSITAQAIWFSYPWFAALMDASGLKVLGQMLERPGGADWLIDQLQDISGSNAQARNPKEPLNPNP